MTTTNNQTKMCEAIKNNGRNCSYKAKPNSCFCGVHKNFIDTSKPLFTEEEKLKEDITPLILKTMYWDINIDVCQRLDEYESDDDEDKVEGETDDERRTRQYEGEFTDLIDMYGEMITDKDDDELREWFSTIYMNKNKVKGFYRLVNDFDDARTILTDIYLENNEFKQDLYNKYIN